MAWCANATHRRNVDKPVDDDASSEPANEEAEVEIEDTEEISAAASKETRLYLWYKRKMITEGQDVAKTSIEPVQVYEEISKIEQQIIDIIESKQNIINRTADSSDGSECCWNDSQLVADSMTDYTGGSLVVPRERIDNHLLSLENIEPNQTNQGPVDQDPSVQPRLGMGLAANTSADSSSTSPCRISCCPDS
ncbi:hypothetical protein D910_05001 [Dendroctonus ponderosae]|uniref:Uncharacterized protein n=1 Tax=Dendroctonus ponderosae TaxID=77166 RepID=U4UCD5_DENPD|nr:hypothetical protein D910_05001 [Dendroctonus ponderosae]